MYNKKQIKTATLNGAIEEISAEINAPKEGEATADEN